MKRLLCGLLLCLGFLETAALGLAEEKSPTSIGTRRELFVDRSLIDSLDNAELVLGDLRDEGPVFYFDQPWEGLFSGYVTVIHDGDRYLLYYRGRPQLGRDGDDREYTCCAISQDGLNWSRPNVDTYEVEGAANNNVVLAHAAPITHNFSPFLDTRPGVPASERFKAVGGVYEGRNNKNSGLFALASEDGLHWRKMSETPVFLDHGWVFDSQNVAFWSDAEQCYLIYYRKGSEKVRAVARVASKDFLNWGEPEQMNFSNTNGPTPQHHLYTSQTHPYFRAPHIYLATAARFMPGRQVISDEQAAQINVHPGYYKDTSDGILMTSRGGNLYDCTFSSGFLRPGLGLQNWVSRTNYPALNVVQTGPAEMSLFVNQDYGQTTSHLRRYSLRLDGLASVRSREKTGTLTTKPFLFEGKELTINFSTSAAGGIRVELQNADGQPLPGFTLNDSQEQIGNEIERTVTWKQGSDVSSLAGQPVRLKFVLQDADLYSFKFNP